MFKKIRDWSEKQEQQMKLSKYKWKKIQLVVEIMIKENKKLKFWIFPITYYINVIYRYKTLIDSVEIFGTELVYKNHETVIGCNKPTKCTY